MGSVEKWQSNLALNVIAGLIVFVFLAIFNWIGPQIDVTIDSYTLAAFAFVLYVFLSLGPIREQLDTLERVNIGIVLRIIGGLFWLFLGIIFIEAQLDGTADPSTNPYVSYIIGGLAIVVGLLQIFGRYNLAKEALWLIIYGEEYRTKQLWKQTVKKISEEMDEELKEEILSAASTRLSKMKKSGQISQKSYQELLKIKKHDETLSFEEFSEKYLE